MDAWWLNCLLPKKKDNCTVKDMKGFLRDEMRILFPVLRCRDLLFECRQKPQQSASEFYLEIKDLAEDCDLGKMDNESLLCHLLLRGLHNSESKSQEKIILDAEGGELRDQRVTSLIANSEMYRSSNKTASKVNEARGGVKKDAKQSDNKSVNKGT